MIDGSPTRSCIFPARAAIGKKITTIEALATGDRLHLLQEAFLKTDALQCGYCTSGMIISAVSLLEKNPDPGEPEIVDFMNGNVCRCGCYPRIVKAIQRAAAEMKGARA